MPANNTAISSSSMMAFISNTLDMTMDAISEAMATIMTFATFSEHIGIINSFIKETLHLMRASKKESNKVLSEKAARSTEFTEVWQRPKPIQSSLSPSLILFQWSSSPGVKRFYQHFIKED